MGSTIEVPASLRQESGKKCSHGDDFYPKKGGLEMKIKYNVLFMIIAVICLMASTSYSQSKSKGKRNNFSVNQSESIRGNQNINVGKNQSISVGKDRIIKVVRNQSNQ